MSTASSEGARLLRVILEAEGLSYRAADRACAFSHDTVAGLIRGEKPTLEEALTIERLYGVAPPKWLEEAKAS